MYKILKADRDTYITDRVVDSVRSYDSNVGIAGSLDIFKLYGITMTGSTPNREVTRLLIHFDMQPLLTAVSQKKVDPNHSSFFAKLQLSDVYGGQPTPDNFTLSVCPLSKSFAEGHGKDVVLYGDHDISNFLTASLNNVWLTAGCGASGSLGTSCDFFTGSVESQQVFVTGEENLSVDVTTAVRALLTGTIPDEGFRIALTQTIEDNNYTYFVKRFASRHAYDTSKHPRLIFGFDDSIRDDAGNMTLDSWSTVFLFNYDHGYPTNLLSASVAITGSNSLKLKMQLAASGGYQEFSFVGGQHYVGSNPATGIYSASIYISSSNSHVITALAASGSKVTMTPIWGSLDGTVPFLTGSKLTMIPPTRSGMSLSPGNLVVSVNGVNDCYRPDEVVTLRVTLFDYTTPFIKVVKVPVESPGALQGIASDAFYSVRDRVTQEVIIPFDTTYGSTRLSSDEAGMFFNLDMDNLVKEHTYVIDIMVIVAGNQKRYMSASPPFKVSDVQ